MQVLPVREPELAPGLEVPPGLALFERADLALGYY